MIDMLPPAQIEMPDPWNRQVANYDVWKDVTYNDTLIPFRNIPQFVSPSNANAFVISLSLVRGTNSGFELIILNPDICKEKTGNQLLFELRLLTALTWDQISTLVGVSRRSVHHWAAGSKISLKYHQRLGELVSALRFIDRGFSELNKDLLMSDVNGEGTAFEFMRDGRFEDVKSALGKGVERPIQLPSLSEDAFAMTGRRSFGQQVAAASDLEDVIDTDIVPISPTGERRAKAKRSKS